jgi:hypothetical protein
VTLHPRLAGAILIAVAVIALAQSWNRWLDPIIDTGRDLYVSERVVHGAKLYRDLRYQYPPLAPYLLGIATRVAGSSLAAFTAIGIAVSMGIALLLYIALRGTAGFAAALLFLSLSFTGASTWGANFVFPYAYAATIGMLFFIGALAALLREQSAVAVACLVAASWCKIEYAAGSVLVIAILIVARRLRWFDAGTYLGAMAVSALAAFACFGAAIRANVFAPSLTHGDIARRFFRNVSGLADWPQNLAVAVASAAAVALIAFLFRSKSKLAVPAVIVAALSFNGDAFFRGWAILQFVALILALRRRDAPLICLSAFSIASTLRVALNVSPLWYGFALVVPVYALAAHVLFESEYRSQWWFAIIAMICVRDLYQQHERFAVKRFPIATQRGVLYDYSAERTAVLHQVIGAVRGPTLAVFPEGVSINYFTKTTTPLSFYMFTPPETGEPSTEAAVIAELNRYAPAQVLIVSRDVSEYGFRGFGVDYNANIFRCLIAKYRVDRSWQGSKFQAILLSNMSN